MPKCPECEIEERQSKFGKNRCGSQRMKCNGCQMTYTLEAKPRGYAEEMRERAVRMYVEGNNFRRIGRLLNVNHQSVVNWVNAYQAKIQNTAAVPTVSETLEIDELWSFVGAKKTKPTS